MTNRLISEEDVRTKIVLPWLESHGFTAANILVESSFDLRLGRNVFQVENGELVRGSNHQTRRHPRLDVLVKASDGRNLMVIEVKSPDVPLDDDAKEQGISYARLLRTGGIAPFVVLTNGRDSKVFDSITGEQLDGEGIPFEHPHVRNGFKVDASDLQLRAVAVEKLISLSAHNFLAFCEASTNSRMELLRGEDINSGKKYIPAIYVERVDPSDRLNQLLMEDTRVILIVGRPQVGKTNFVCRQVEERIRQGTPCLFYPAISMQGGLLEEIRNDFGWHLHEVNDVIHIVQKLVSVLRSSKQKLVLFIDGWNEVDVQTAYAIGQACERLSCDEITVVISMTNLAASRLLLDAAGNCVYVAQATGVDHSGVPLIEVSPERLDDRQKAVYIGNYTPDEREETYQVYSQAYSVHVPPHHQPVDDPFLLRILMEHFQGRDLPGNFNESDLILASLKRKAQRAGTLSWDAISTLLTELCRGMLDDGGPVRHDVALRRWNYPMAQDLPHVLFEAALLTRKTDKSGLSVLDFYYERDRNFVASHWVVNWELTLNRTEQGAETLETAMRTRVGAESLSWFFNQAKYRDQLKIVSESHFVRLSQSAKRLLLSCLCNTVWQHEITPIWMLEIARQGLRDSEALVKVQATKLLALLSEEYEELADILSENLDFIPDVLRTAEEFPLESGSVGQVVLDALRRLYWDSHPGDDDESPVTILLSSLATGSTDSLAKAASTALGFAAPYLFLRSLSNFIASSQFDSFKMGLYYEGLNNAISELGESYYGSMCPGCLEGLRADYESGHSDELKHEYLKMKEVCVPVIQFYWPNEASKQLQDILDDLKPRPRSGDDDVEPYLQPTRAILESCGQLRLPFEENKQEAELI